MRGIRRAVACRAGELHETQTETEEGRISTEIPVPPFGEAARAAEYVRWLDRIVNAGLGSHRYRVTFNEAGLALPRA